MKTQPKHTKVFWSFSYLNKDLEEPEAVTFPTREKARTRRRLYAGKNTVSRIARVFLPLPQAKKP